MFDSSGDLICPICYCYAGGVDEAQPGDPVVPYPGRASKWYIVPECGHGEYELQREERFDLVDSDLEDFQWFTDEGSL